MTNLNRIKVTEVGLKQRTRIRSAQGITIARPWYILLYVLILLLLASSSFVEYRSRYRELLSLIQDQAAITAAVVAQSSANQVLFNTEIRSSYIDRGMDVLSFLDRLEEKGDLTPEQLEAVIAEEGVFQVAMLDETGGSISELRPDGQKGMTVQTRSEPTLQQKVRPLLQGSETWMVEDLHREGGESDAVADRSLFIGLARRSGGVFVAQLNSESQELYQYLTNLELGLEELIRVQGMQYLILDIPDSDPFTVSKSGLLPDSSWTRSNLENILYQVSKRDLNWLEVVRPVFFREGIGEVRLGFEAALLFKLRDQILTQILLRGLLLVGLAFVSFWYVIARQNTALLEREKQRIENQVLSLEKLNRQREKQAAMGELAAGVAHEIRNPLNAIAIAAQRLKREFKPQTETAEYGELTSSMVMEINRINQSLQEFLNYTKPMALNMVRIQAGSWLEEARKLHESQALDKQISLKLETADFEFEADPVYLKQALSNLINNALEACASGDSIVISGRRERDIIKLGVRDTGPGIPEADQARLFDLYFSTKDMGTGVGLALTYKIIADHGGSIEVQSSLGAGSYFELNIPVRT